jgi:membrane-associated protease RseP (regulator of RpoE activity)
MRGSFAPVAIGIACGLAVVALWSLFRPAQELPAQPPSVPAPASVASGGAESEIAELRSRLIAELETRNELAQQLDELRIDVEGLVARLGELEAGDEETDDEQPEQSFDEAPLREAGLTNREAQELHERFDQAVLDRLYLRDQAIREGWFGGPRWRLSTIGFRVQLQDEIGAERYDWLQYAAGRTNRVVIREVISGSVAADAGLRRGDVLLAYDGREVFSIGDLRVLLSSGQAGARVELGFDRDGRYQTLTVERGPLGAYLDELRVAPAPLR